MSLSAPEIWALIAVIGLGTYLIRFSFLGLLAGRDIPGWALRLLRYTPVAVIPGLVAPLVVWPAATGGTPDPARMIAAIATLAVGAWTRNLLAGILAGGAALYLSLPVF